MDPKPQIFPSRTVMAIKAPKGTKMALPYPEENGADNAGYQIYLQSPDGPVDIYMVNIIDDRPHTEGYVQQVGISCAYVHPRCISSVEGMAGDRVRLLTHGCMETHIHI
jgi:hypothetical protein